MLYLSIFNININNLKEMESLEFKPKNKETKGSNNNITNLNLDCRIPSEF